MSLMIPPKEHRATSIAPVTMKRPFRVSYECIGCEKVGTSDITMLDETSGAATVEDFEASGALGELDPNCSRCGSGHIAITGIAYIRQPTDGPRE